MANRNWMMWVSAIGFSSSLWGCGSSSDDPAPMNSGGTTSTAGTVGSGGSAGTTAAAGGGAGGAAGGGGGSGGTASACAPLMPTGTVHQLIISEIVPGTGIEIFNPGTAAVPLADVWFCSQYDYQEAVASNAQTEVPAGGYVVVDWPESYTLATPAGGEMLMMINADGVPTPETTQTYVCWGNHAGGRQGDTSSGANVLYMGNCAPAMTAGSLARKAGTDGLGAASYDATVAPSLADCAP